MGGLPVLPATNKRPIQIYLSHVLIISRSDGPGDRHQLIQSRTPAVVEPHGLVFPARLGIAMDDEGGEFRSVAVRLQGDNRRECEFISMPAGPRYGGTITRCERVGPDQLPVGDDLQKATHVREGLAFG